MSMNKVMTVQEGIKPEAVEEPKQIQLRSMLKEKKIFEQLEISEQAFFNNFALLVNANAVNSLDVYVDETAQVVILPRIIGG